MVKNRDNFYRARPGAHEVRLDLFGDYKSNVALYPSFQEYFRTHKPPILAVWGKNDPFSCRQVPRRSSATILGRLFASSIRATSRSKHMLVRSPKVSATS
jgi:hypothetical protein